MNNWRLLLLAVVAVLQPIESFTELNLIDGRQECCDHGANSVTQGTRLHGTHRKTTPEERRLSSREDIREERRYEARNDPITRSKERLTLERVEKRISPESSIRFSAETRFARDQGRRYRSVDDKESRKTRPEQRRRARTSVSKNSIGQYERDVLDSRRIRMSRDDTRAEITDNERLYKKSLHSQDTSRVRDSEDLHRTSANRETMAVFRGKRDDVIRNVVRRDSRIIAFQSVTRLPLDNNRERRSLDRRTRDNVDESRVRSLESGVNSVNEREELRSQIDLRENRRNNFRVISQRIDERRQRDQTREFRDRTSAVILDSSERISGDRRRESRATIERVDRSRRDIKDHNSERIDERHQQDDESRLFRERMLILRGSKVRSAMAEQEQALTRESRKLEENVRSERIMRSNDRAERRETTKNMLQASHDTTTERRQNFRASRMLEATASVERLVSIDERRDEHRQLSRSLDRDSVRSSRTVKSMEREHNSRTSTRFPEINVRGDRVARRRDVESVERLNERKEQRDENRMSRDRTIAMLRESRESAERRQEILRTVSLSRFEKNARSDRKSRIYDNLRDDLSHRERKEQRQSREQTLYRMARDTDRRPDRKSSTTSGFIERAASDERLDMHRETRDESRVRDRTLEIQRYGIRRTSRNTETNARLQQTRILEHSRVERRELRERDEKGASHYRISLTRLTRETIERREALGTRNSQVDARNEIIRNRGDVRMSERLEVHHQQDESRSNDRALQRQARDIIAARSIERRFREVSSRDGEIRSKKLSRSHDDKRTNVREVHNNIRDLKAMESRLESIRLMERKVQQNRRNLAMERMDLKANRAIHDMRFEAKLRTSDIFLTKDMRTDTRRDAIDTPFRSFEAKFRGINAVDETSDNQNAMNWQMIFYTLQGAYLCGLLMQILTEKTNKDKSRNFTWWAASSKDLVKVD